MHKTAVNLLRMSQYLMTHMASQIAWRGAFCAAVCCTLLWPTASFAQVCDSAVTDMEKLYCQVKEAGHGQSLPRFDDFRRNAPAVQRLLLKRPVKRAGLSLPASTDSRRKPKTALKPKPQPETTNPANPPRSAKGKPASQSANSRITRNTNKLAFEASLAAEGAGMGSSLGGCMVQTRKIICAAAQFELRDNLANKKLAANALTPANMLRLPHVPDYSSNRELHQYLQLAYTEYLHKMLGIGLAGATLTYSKFYYIFEEVHGQQHDFVQRFADMFTYLKKDKSTIAVAARHRNSSPPDISQCQQVSAQLIACDVQGVNWVYHAS